VLVQLDGHAPRRCRHLVEAVPLDPGPEFPRVVPAPCPVRAGLGLVTEEFDTLGLKACHFCVHAALPGNPNLLSGGGSKKSKVLLRDCRNTAARRRRSFLRLPRRAFIDGLRYGQGRLYAKNARDALR
jgi:hypothetical protein